MKVAVLRSVRSVVVEERPIPNIAAGEVLLRIRAAGICGSDIHGFQGIWPDKRALGLVMGHENSGEAVEVGRDVKAFKVGDRVVIDPQLSCGECEECTQGWMNLCRNMKLIGSSSRGIRHGGFAEYIAMPERNLHRLPDNLSFEEGALFDPLGNAVHLINRSGVKVGDRIAIFGAGTLGLCLLLVAKNSGAAEVTIIDISPFKLEVARRLGADRCINGHSQDPVKAILEATNGQGVEIAVEAVGIKETYIQCLSVAKRGGKVMALGNMAEEISVALFRLVSREISIIGCTGFTPREIDQALALMSVEKINARPIITHRYSLGQAQAAFEETEKKDNELIKAFLLP